MNFWKNHKRLSWPSKILIGIVIFLVAARIALPYVGLRLINQALSEKLGAYTGLVKDIHIALYRGAYQLKGFEIRKRQGDAPPILAIETLDLSLAWRALIHKQLNADITIRRGQLNLIDSAKSETKQLGNENSRQTWAQILNLVVPFSIESLKIEDSSAFFTNGDVPGFKRIRLEDANFELRNLRNGRDLSELSPFWGTALLQKSSKLKISGGIDILDNPLRFYIGIELPNFQIKTVNMLLMTYIPMDITSGKFSFYSEAASEKGQVHGYAKVFLKDGDIIAPKQKFVSIKHFFFEIIGAVGNWILANNKTKSIAMQIPFKTEKGKLDVNTSAAFWSQVKNKFNALPQGLDHSVHLQSVAK